MAGPTHDPGAKNAPATHEKITLVRGGREAMEAVDNVIANLPARMAALQEAKNTADPAAIRASVAQVASMRSILDVARTSLQRAVPAAAPAERERFAAAMAKASAQMAQLDEPIERAHRQALLLETTRSGALAQVPSGEVSNDPEENRARAAQLAPLGLCDDPTMQSRTSPVCHLDVPQREALRLRVANGIAGIADKWLHAIAHEHVKHRLKPLFQKSGLNPVLEILLNVMLSWLTGQAGNAVLKGVQGARNLNATRQLGRDLELVAAISPVNRVGISATAPPLPKPAETLISGLGSKLTERAVAATKASSPRSDDVSAFFDQLGEVAISWKQHAADDIQQLTDPLLTSLAEGLERSDHSVASFRGKLQRLIEGFEQVEKIGMVTVLGPEPLTLVRVVHATGQTRLALARAAVDVIENHAPSISREPGDPTFERRNGRLTFVSWVDASLSSFALARGPEQIPVLMASDARWDNPDRPELARWREDAGARDDVQMLGPSNSASMDVQRGM